MFRSCTVIRRQGASDKAGRSATGQGVRGQFNTMMIPTGASFPSTRATGFSTQMYFAGTRRPNQPMQRNKMMEKTRERSEVKNGC
jgi:hypothetical protein